MTRHAYEIADLIAELRRRDAMHDQRSEDAMPEAFPPLAPQADLDRIPVSDMHQLPEEPDDFDSAAYALFALGGAACFLGGLGLGAVLW